MKIVFYIVLLLSSIFACADDSAKFKITDEREFVVADIDDCVVLKGTALYFGIDESQTPAGKFGRVIVSKNGKFAFEKKPDADLRFFGYNGVLSRVFVLGDPEKTKANIRERVAMTRAQGYNAVCLWYSGASRGKKGSQRYNEWYDAVDYLVAELKKNGIYIQYRLVNPDMGQEGYTFERRDEPKFRCLMGDPEMLAVWRDYALDGLTRVNPYTGMTLAEDPIVIGVNFFGEMNSGYDRLLVNIPDLAPLGDREWRKWLVNKYGTIEKLNEKWTPKIPLKNFDEVKVAEVFGKKVVGGFNDWYLFIAYKHEEFNKFCRGVLAEAGYKGLVWEGDGSRRMTEVLPRAKTSDIVPLDIYYCHPLGGWGKKGNKVKQDSAVGLLGSYVLSTMSMRINDRPLILMEHNYCHWNQFKREGGLLMPAYGSFQGFSQMFIHSGPVVKKAARVRAFSAGDSPVMRANEVLTYLLFRRGDVAQSKKKAELLLPQKWFDASPAVRFAMNPNQSAVGLMVGFASRLPDLPRPDALANSIPQKADITFAPSGFAEIFAQDWFSEVQRPKGGHFNIAEFVGVMRDKNILPKENLSNPKDGIFQTDTGEITMRAKEKLLKIVTPKTEAISFLANKNEKLGLLEIKGSSVDACVALSAIDGAEIKDSSRLLLVYTTEDRNTGETYSADGLTLIEIGKAPTRLRAGKLEAIAKLKKGTKFAMYALAFNGVRREKIPLKKLGDNIEISIDTAKLKNGATVFFEIVAEAEK